MTNHTLAIGDRTYSSWSLRGWLMFAKFEIPVTVRSARMKTPEFAQLLEEFGPAQTVPALRFGDVIVSDSLAMAETLAEARPEIWPADPVARGMARSMVAEMHSGFGALREACPMNLLRCYDNFEPDKDVTADIERVILLWQQARDAFGSDGQWLFGQYSLADVFYAPVAMRFATYRLPTTEIAAAYITAHLHDLHLRRWRAMGLAENYIRDYYDKDLPELAWPGPKPLPAKILNGGVAINQICPFSGKPVSSEGLVQVDGSTLGFCNRFCRDKVASDPEAWPEAMALLS